MKGWTNIAFSNIGKRSENQDFFYSKSIKAKRRKYFLLLVCDGLGGHPNGKECSKAVGTEIVQVVTSYLQKRKSRQPLNRKYAIRICRLLSSLKTLEAPATSRTTASLMLIDQKNKSCISIWAGDSRMYFADRSGVCRQVSYDHCDEENKITVVYDGNGKLYGQLSYDIIQSKTPLMYAVTSDGMNTPLDKLFTFLYGCIFHNIQNHNLFESKATHYIEKVISDNYTAVMLYFRYPKHIVLKSFNGMQINEADQG